MRYFSLLDFQHLVLALFLGAVALVFALAAWGGYPRREGRGGGDREIPQAPEPGATPGAEDNPIAPFLVFVYVGILFAALGYALVVGFLGRPVGY